MAKPKEIPKKRKKRSYTVNHSKELIDLAVEALKNKYFSLRYMQMFISTLSDVE